MVERDALGRFQVGGPEEVGDLAGHVEDDRQLRGFFALMRDTRGPSSLPPVTCPGRLGLLLTLLA
ncbi:hypothetical protein [Streptomyces sp. NPDC058466]|uniref:hypothetical protein n=1 Tax=Streptomyces sp. NPDC058466 TaxID=3346512 RepID=UPI003657E737